LHWLKSPPNLGPTFRHAILRTISGAPWSLPDVLLVAAVTTIAWWTVSSTSITRTVWTASEVTRCQSQKGRSKSKTQPSLADLTYDAACIKDAVGPKKPMTSVMTTGVEPTPEIVLPCFKKMPFNVQSTTYFTTQNET